MSGTVQMKVSVPLSEALKLYSFVDRDIAGLGQEGRSVDPAQLVVKRRALSIRIAELASLIDAERRFADDQELASQMHQLFSDFRDSVARHQEKWPPDDAAASVEAFLTSAKEVQDRSLAFRLWCESHLD